MKNLGTKKNVFFFGLIGTTILAVMTYLSTSGICYHNDACLNFFEEFRPWNFMSYIFFAPPLFLLSLITYKMKDEVFRAWWDFAWWWSLLIVGVTFLLTHAQGGGTLGMNQDFTFFVLSILYALLVIVSLYRIMCAHRESKHKNK